MLLKHTLFKVLYFILAKFKNYEIVYKYQKYFIYTFIPLNIQYMSAVYQPLNMSKGTRISNTYF